MKSQSLSLSLPVFLLLSVRVCVCLAECDSGLLKAAAQVAICMRFVFV